jgi:hypothetical protein
VLKLAAKYVSSGLFGRPIPVLDRELEEVGNGGLPDDGKTPPVPFRISHRSGTAAGQITPIMMSGKEAGLPLRHRAGMLCQRRVCRACGAGDWANENLSEIMAGRVRSGKIRLP